MENTETIQAPQEYSINSVLSKSFGWMALGLLISAIVSVVVAVTPALIYAILGSGFGFIACLLVELGIVIYLSRRIASMPAARAKFFFILYAIVSGLTLSVIFFAYQLTSIISIFLATMVMFGVLALYGARTSKDLSKIGALAGFGLIGLIVALLINMFLKSGTLDLILSWIGVAIFTVLIAYDVQKIKALVGTVTTPEEKSKAGIIGALKLYLDFINLFLNLLRIFGRRK